MTGLPIIRLPNLHIHKLIKIRVHTVADLRGKSLDVRPTLGPIFGKKMAK